MRLLFDQGLPTSAASILRAGGWDVIHASEAGLDRATDEAVLEFARKDGLEAGAVVSVTNRAIRIRRLPVIRKS